MRNSIRTLPRGRTWRRCLGIYTLFAGVALPIGFITGLLEPEVARLSPGGFAMLAVSLAVRPAFLEELVFRVLLLPRDPRRHSRLRLGVISAAALTAYVLIHPLNAWLLRPARSALFTSPEFLVCAALLGLACTLAYLMSRSIWPPFAMHWITVVVWIGGLGGHELLGR